MKANVYVDGFNLYYGAVKNTPYRWLNIAAARSDQPDQILYPLVSPRPHDPDQPTRQQTYLRALRTIPDLTIILGSFLTHDVMMPLKKTVGLLNPQKHPCRALLPHVKFIKQIRLGVLAKSQFPLTLTDARGRFSKPAAW